MKLGEVAQINISVSDLQTSLAFYQKLGHDEVEVREDPYPWARMSDGQNLIMLNQDGNRYLGLVYFSQNATRRVTKLEETGIEFVQRREKDGELIMAVFVAPGNLAVGLIKFDPEEIPRPAGRPLTKIGTFGELALPVSDYSAAVEFWRKLGFAILHESEEPYPRGIISDEHIVLGLHQNGEYDDPLVFNSPAMTYFAPDMAERIAQLKGDGIIFNTEMPSEHGAVGNATLRGPNGESIFLFEGEI